MRPLHSLRDIARLLPAGIAILLTCITAAGASVISASPTLPILGVPYGSAVGVGCFPAAGVCVQPGTLTLTAPVVTTFGTDEDIITGAIYNGVLTKLNGVPIGVLTLSGTVEQLVHGRTSPTDTGSWLTELVALSLSGPLGPDTLTLGLDPAHASLGTSSITPFYDGDNRLFRISSFFDIFVELSVDGQNPLHATRGPLHVEAGIPEPAGLTLLATALIGLFTLRRQVPAGLTLR